MAINFKNHAARTEGSRIEIKTSPEVAEARLKDAMEMLTGERALDLYALGDLFIRISSDPNAFFGANAALAAAVVDWLVTKVTGLDIPDGSIKDALLSSDNAGVRKNFGATLMKFLDDNLAVEEVAQGHLNRNSGQGERDSMAMLIGSALRLQVGDMLMDWITQAIPFKLGAGLKDVAERFDKAMNLDDALEDIIQVPMQEVIEKGMQQWYARKIKAQDYTESEARQAFLREQIDQTTYNKVLDNQGVRDDIRDVLLDMAEPNLTESDLDQLYQHNLLSIEQVSDQYKQKGFRPETRKLKTDLVEKTRRWKLEERILELYGNLYRDDVALQSEVTPFLEHLGYEPDEIEMYFKVQELERRQRKWLSAAQCNNLARAGLVKPDFLIEYEIKQGMLPEDAMLLYMNNLLAMFPAPTPADPNQEDECTKLIKSKFTLAKFLSALLNQIPILDTKGLFNTADIQQILECLLKQAQNP